MDAFQHIKDTETLAHAYLIRGGDGSLELLKEALAGRGVVTQGNPDLYSVSFEALGVDEVRAVTDYASLAPLGDSKYILVSVKSATDQAQNALLKVLEEATGRSKFFLIFEPGAKVLPTLISRCVMLRTREEESTEEAEEFLALPYKDRLLVGEKFAKNHDREGARALVRSLLALAHAKKFDSKALRDLLDADRYLALSGSSPKGVIGHLALTL